MRNHKDTAVHLAVNECIDNNILREFLISQKVRVIQMSIFEFDADEEIRKLRKSEFKYGKDVGLEEGHALGIEEGAAAIVKLCIQLGMSKDQTFVQIQKSMNMDDSAASVILEKYWRQS